MENRFGFKDFVLATLVVVLILVVFLGMKQLDNQAIVLKTIAEHGDAQTRLLASVERELNDHLSFNSGPTTAPTNSQSQSSHGDPVRHI